MLLLRDSNGLVFLWLAAVARLPAYHKLADAGPPGSDATEASLPGIAVWLYCLTRLQ
jgi:hypothetical protein